MNFRNVSQFLLVNLAGDSCNYFYIQNQNITIEITKFSRCSSQMIFTSDHLHVKVIFTIHFTLPTKGLLQLQLH